MLRACKHFGLYSCFAAFPGTIFPHEKTYKLHGYVVQPVKGYFSPVSHTPGKVCIKAYLNKTENIVGQMSLGNQNNTQYTRYGSNGGKDFPLPRNNKNKKIERYNGGKQEPFVWGKKA